MNRPRIIIDLDHVVYDFVRVFAEWLSINNALPATKFNTWGGQMNVVEAMHAYDSWGFHDNWGMSKGEWMRWWRLGIEADYIYKKGDVIPGARDAIWRLNDAEWHIVLATKRLNVFGLHDKIIESTVSWLKDNNIPYREMLFITDKKTISSLAIVDDVEYNMRQDIHGATFLFPSNHNTDHYVEDAEKREMWESIVNDLV